MGIFPDWLAIIAAMAFGAAMVAIPGALIWQRRGAAMGGNGLHRAVFLFDAGDLIDATGPARALLRLAPPAANDWQRLRNAVRTRFPAFPRDPPDELGAGAPAPPCLHSEDGASLVIESLDGITHVVLHEAVSAQAPAPAPGATASALRQLERDVSTLRPAVDCAPYPIWQTDGTGLVLWHNEAYRAVFEAVHGKPPDPATRLFPSALDDKPSGARMRASLGRPDDAAMLWFDIHVIRAGDVLQFYAIDINPVVSAEIAQRNFVQTLAKTFAQLSTGLAIFDRNRQLALFNPALIDLTALSAEFLSGRPNLLSFFDRLRDSAMMPEPKNYGSWREQIAALVAAASDGSYAETWSLPSGSTYRVTGRPHPDGAVAFLFEDISAEISLTRRFRAELELNQVILDRIEPAVAVFSASGILFMANRGYAELWGDDPDRRLTDMTILDASRAWQAQCRPSALWGELRDFVRSAEDRAEWGGEVATLGGALLRVNVQPLPAGRSLISFRRTDVVAAPRSRIPDLSAVR